MFDYISHWTLKKNSTDSPTSLNIKKIFVLNIRCKENKFRIKWFFDGIYVSSHIFHLEFI